MVKAESGECSHYKKLKSEKLKYVYCRGKNTVYFCGNGTRGTPPLWLGFTTEHLDPPDAGKNDLITGYPRGVPAGPRGLPALLML